MVFDKPRTLKEMQDYYQKNYKTYHEKTFSIDPSSFLEPLARQLPSKAFVMDVGCGSGRDLLWMKKRGFNVIGVEHSSGLAELARKNAGCEIVEGDFETYDFSNLHVDAIVLVGALVHVQHHRLQTVFKNITNSLDKKGKVLITLKEGEGTFIDGYGRIFYLWQDKELRGIFTENGFKILDFKRQVSKVQTNDIWLGYVLEKAVGGF